MRFLLLCALFASTFAHSTSWHQFSLTFEGGLSAILTNEYQSGSAGTRFDFTDEAKEGGFLFPNWRAALGLRLFQNHDFELTYQPVFLDTEGVAKRQLQFDNILVSKGDSFKARYYFPFYRFSYFYRIINQPNYFWSLGAGLQMRSVSISIFDENSRSRFVQNNIGPVPLLVTRFRYDFANRLFVATDIAGWWSPIPIANGSDKATTGWIYDAALQGGIRAQDWLDIYLSARIIGGGADGDGSERASGDRYTYNSLNILNFNAGFLFRF